MGEGKVQKQTLGFYFVWYTNVALSIAFSYYMMHLIANNQIQPLIVTSIRQSYALIAIYLLAHAVILWVLGQLKKNMPSLEPIHTCLNNVINNSILYFVILICLVFGQNYNKIYSQHQILQIIELFIWGRILFSIGYTIGTYIGAQSLRSYGFGLCIASLLTLFLSLIDVNFLQAFK